jgi:hypothetical protein
MSVLGLRLRTSRNEFDQTPLSIGPARDADERATQTNYAWCFPVYSPADRRPSRTVVLRVMPPRQREDNTGVGEGRAGRGARHDCSALSSNASVAPSPPLPYLVSTQSGHQASRVRCPSGLWWQHLALASISVLSWALGRGRAIGRTHEWCASPPAPPRLWLRWASLAATPRQSESGKAAQE